MVCFASFTAAASRAAFDESAGIKAQAGEKNDDANGMESDGAPAGDGDDHSHAIFVWSIVLGCISGGLGIVGLVLWLVFRYEKKRTAALELVAKELGLQFSPHADERLLAKLQQFRLFNWGQSRRMKNVMTAETEHVKLTIFDYQFTTSGGQQSHTYSHTLVAFESATLQLPQFSVWPEGFIDKMGAKLGSQDIDFDEHPEFSSMFVLQSDDESTVRTVFNRQILDMFAAQPGISADSSPGLLTYRKAERRKPAEIRDFMTEAYAFFNAFQESIS